MSGIALPYTYRYPFASELAATSSGPKLRLAACGGTEEDPHFFRGKLTRPRRTADLLRTLTQVVQARYYTPPSMVARILALADPVVTSGGDILRFEAFSACCSTYARVDLLPPALKGDLLGRGTTNVDFNRPLRAALARIRDADEVGLSIGADALELARGEDKVVERKVPLPVRWLKGFVEAQAYQARMRVRVEITGFEASRFLRSLPRSGSMSTGWVVTGGRRLRLSQRESPGAVPLAGMERLRVLEDVAQHARAVRIYADEQTPASAWVLVLDEARFHLVLSPEVRRGFSGEGQVLGQLADGRWREALPRVQASLQWESKIEIEPLVEKTSLDRDTITAALAALGARGLVGYDLAEGAYFHRVLPFDLSRSDALQPRHKDARKL